METWHDAGAADEVHGPPWPQLELAGVRLQLVRDGEGTIHAVAATCPHLGSPLGRAPVTGATLECPFHWYAFRLEDGANLHPGWDDCTLAVHRTEVHDGRVRVWVAA